MQRTEKNRKAINEMLNAAGKMLAYAHMLRNDFEKHADERGNVMVNVNDVAFAGSMTSTILVTEMLIDTFEEIKDTYFGDDEEEEEVQ